ncbi:Membrane transport protein [Photorhabdus australis subsp. thailandensis]|uniref:Membrane transport protein n=1 Tax=Photorhabdus australis subsp. thailandensis TaxID=2805096 RepID=A0A1C0U3K6_9GAMM|nr:AEC family transporter [Photorhabdus australis]OCQ52473.1 Membrane transport protein [Photorhabdus australis subsp. thailandensis]
MFFEIMFRVALLILITLIGFFVGKKLDLREKDISSLLIYIISPLVIFVSIIQSPSDWTYFKYSIASLLTASIAASIAYLLGRYLWSDGKANLFGFAGGTGNTGYFALPIAFAIFNPNQIAIAIFIIIGINLYEFTIGYFITAKGHLTTKESITKIIKLPIIYAVILGIILKSSNTTLHPILISTLNNFKGAYSILGMMVIGITLSSIYKMKIDWEFSFFALLWKHLIYPILGLLSFHYIANIPHDVLVVITLMLATPMAGNVVVIANNLNVHPEKAALSVILSTTLAIVTVPLAIVMISQET